MLGVLGAFYASLFPGLDGLETTKDNMTPDILVTSAHVYNLTPEEVQKLEAGGMPFTAGEFLTAKLPDGSELKIAAEDRDQNPDTPPELVISGRVDGGKTGQEGRVVEMVFKEADLLKLKGQSPVLMDDGDPATTLAHLVARNVETPDSKAYAEMNAWERFVFALKDQKYNWGWFVSTLGAGYALVTSYRHEMNGNLTPAEVERKRRKRTKENPPKKDPTV